MIKQINLIFSKIPYSIIALLGRVAMASVFWLSAQTKTTGFQFNLLTGNFQFGLPKVNETALYLFANEYNLPFIDPTIAAWLAMISEHLFAALLLLGLLTRFSALALFVMTLVIQLFVYPDAYALHFTWMAILLLLMQQGAGKVSVDYWLARRNALN